MKRNSTLKFILSILVFTLILNKSYSQVPILYYDFENNTTRTTFENLVEQSINAGSGALTRAGNTTTISGVGGAGIFNGGAAAGQALTGSNWHNATTDPGTGATNYYQFIVNTTGFSGISISFDNQASSTGPARVGILWSTDGSTFNTATTSPVLTGNNTLAASGSFVLPSGVNNQSSVTIRVYAYAGDATDRTGRSAFGTGGTFRIDNLTVFATTATATKTLLDYPAMGLSIKSGTAFIPTYSDLTVNGGGITVTVNGTLQLSGVLTLTAGTLNTANNLTLKSTSATITARVAPVTGSITGNVTVERFIPARRAWRLLTAPISATGAPTINAAWQEGQTSGNSNPGFGTQITGGTVAEGFDQNTGSTYSIKNFNGTTWFAVANTTPTLITASPAYMLFVRGDRSVALAGSGVTPTNTILRVTGALKTGSQIMATNSSGFTALGNPFASPVDHALTTKTNVTQVLYLWDPKRATNGSWVAFDGGNAIPYTPNSTGGSYSGPNSIIQSGQGFLVESSGGAGLVGFAETHKSTVNQDVFRVPGLGLPLIKSFRANLHYLHDDNSITTTDGLLVMYGNDYTNKITKEDVNKLTNFEENLSILREGKNICIEKRALIDKSDTLYFNLLNTTKRNYQFEFVAENLAHPGIEGFLVDNFLKTKIPIDLNGTTKVNFIVNDVAASAAANRFSVVFGKPSSIITNLKTGISVYPNPVTNGNVTLQLNNMPKGIYKVKIVNALGQAVVNKQIDHAGGTLSQTIKINTNKGAYMLEVISPGNNKQMIRILAN